MGRKERRLREQQELKQSILDAAREIALAEGWRNVTMRKIAERIEYSHPAIYDYFENKDVLFLDDPETYLPDSSEKTASS